MTTDQQNLEKQEGLELNSYERKVLRRVTAVFLLAWTLVIASFLWIAINHEDKIIRKLAKMEAVTVFNKDVAFRIWASSQRPLHKGSFLAMFLNRDLSQIESLFL